MPDVSDLLKKFTKAYGKDLTHIDDEDPPRIPTGFFAFDLASGGGFPVGRVSVIFGPESSMKSSLCLRAISGAQIMYPELTPIYIDVEGSYSKEWASRMGVDPNRIVVLVPETAEQMVDTVEQLLYAEDVSVIVVDSLAALVTNKELESSAEDFQVGTAGLLINKFYRKVTRALAQVRSTHSGKAAPTLLCINQIRFKIGVSHGNPETMPGGPSFNYASSLTVRLYGKDEMDAEVSKSMPAFKKISCILKKWKVPVVQKNAEWMVALLPNEKFNLAVGQSYDLSTIFTYLKTLGMLVKGKDSWDLTVADIAQTYKTQDLLKKQLIDDAAFGLAVRSAIIARVLSSGDIAGDP